MKTPIRTFTARSDDGAAVTLEEYKAEPDPAAMCQAWTYFAQRFVEVGPDRRIPVEAVTPGVYRLASGVVVRE